MRYGCGTELTVSSGGFGGFVGGKVLCSDGRVRRLVRVAPFAADFLGPRGAVRVDGRTVSGSVGIGRDESGDEYVDFVAHGRNAGLLPRWSDR